MSLWDSLSIPPIGDSTFPNGFPRHGDGFNIDVAEPDSLAATLADATFTYSEGPTQRFVIDLNPAGPVPFNVLPGGEVWDNASPHFADEAELWRRNENHSVVVHPRRRRRERREPDVVRAVMRSCHRPLAGRTTALIS